MGRSAMADDAFAGRRGNGDHGGMLETSLGRDRVLGRQIAASRFGAEHRRFDVAGQVLKQSDPGPRDT